MNKCLSVLMWVDSLLKRESVCSNTGDESISHPVISSRSLIALSLFAAQLASLPEAIQEEDKPAAEEEANEEQGEGFQSGKHCCQVVCLFVCLLSADI